MWIEDINGRCGCEVNFPIVADSHRMVAYDYDMLEYQDMNQSDGNLGNYTLHPLSSLQRLYILLVFVILF